MIETSQDRMVETPLDQMIQTSLDEMIDEMIETSLDEMIETSAEEFYKNTEEKNQLHHLQRVKHDDIYKRFDLFIMKNGKKTKAQKIIREVFNRLSTLHAKKTHTWVPGAVIFKHAIANVEPLFEMKKYRKGSTTQVRPIPCSQKRRQSIAYRWILESVRKGDTKKTSFCEALARVLYASFMREGKIFQRRNEVHKLAEANKMAIR